MQVPQFVVHADVEERHWWFLARRRILQRLIGSLMPPDKSTKMVDVGCGTGGFTAFMNKNYTCMGFDPIAEGIDFAKQRFLGTDFRTGVAQDFPELVSNADAVLIIGVMEHIEHDQPFVLDILKMMKPGAYLVMTAPADESLWSPHDDGFEHYRRYNEQTWRRLWQGAPVKELLVSYYNRRLYPLIKLVRVITKWKGSTVGPGDTDLHVPIAPLNWLLQSIFYGESGRLLRVLKGKTTGFKKGVSVIAILQKEAS